MKRKCLIILLMFLLIVSVVNALENCKREMNSGEIPCRQLSSWDYPNDCNTYTVSIYISNSTLLDTRTMDNYGIINCNITFNYTSQGSYFLNFSSGDTAIIIIEEDANMLIALVIGVSLIVALFIFLTFAVKEDKPFLANFFFLGIFIFATILSNLLWKITSVNSAPYEPIMYIVYYTFLVITMLMIFIVLVMLTVEAVKIRKIAGNPVDNYRDNLGKNE
jgi:hypothetical protein